MKIGDYFIAEKFKTNANVDFIEDMEDYVGLECKVINIDYDYKSPIYNVIFNDGESWWWKESALKPVKTN